MNVVTPAATSRYSMLEPMPRSARNVKPWVMPGTPASPQNSAYSDHPNAASTPSEMRVSSVADVGAKVAHSARARPRRAELGCAAANGIDGPRDDPTSDIPVE